MSDRMNLDLLRKHNRLVIGFLCGLVVGLVFMGGYAFSIIRCLEALEVTLQSQSLSQSDRHIGEQSESESESTSTILLTIYPHDCLISLWDLNCGMRNDILFVDKATLSYNNGPYGLLLEGQFTSEETGLYGDMTFYTEEEELIKIFYEMYLKLG